MRWLWWWRENNRKVVVVVVEGNSTNVVVVKTIEMRRRMRENSGIYGLKAYINAQHSSSFSVYILLLRS